MKAEGRRTPVLSHCPSAAGCVCSPQLARAQGHGRGPDASVLAAQRGPGQPGPQGGTERGPVPAGPAGLGVPALSQSGWDVNTEGGKTLQPPPISFLNQKLRLVTILVCCGRNGTESLKPGLFGKILDVCSAELQPPRGTVDNSGNLCPSPLPAGPALGASASSVFPMTPPHQERKHARGSAARGLVSSRGLENPCSQLSGNTSSARNRRAERCRLPRQPGLPLTSAHSNAP